MGKLNWKRTSVPQSNIRYMAEAGSQTLFAIGSVMGDYQAVLIDRRGKILNMGKRGTLRQSVAWCYKTLKENNPRLYADIKGDY